MKQVKIRMTLVYKGDYVAMKKELEQLPQDVSLLIEDEPYCAIQQKSVCNTFKLVLHDPRFVFDDLFVARQFYFSSGPSREIVMKHPKFLSVINKKKYFMDYFYERYGSNAGTTHVGMLQRYIQAERVIQFWRKRTHTQNQFRILFHLYPMLVKYSRNFKERYYAPDGPGYLRALANFQRHKHMATL